MKYLNELNYNSKRMKILQYLLTRGAGNKEGCDVKDIALDLDFSVSAVRHYLSMLERDNMIVRSEKKGHTGRPATLYRLSDKGIDTFPKSYTSFSLDILEELDKFMSDDEILNILPNIGLKEAKSIQLDIEKNNQYRINNHKNDLREKVNDLVKIFHIRGLFPALDENDSHFLLRNYNCKLFHLAKIDPRICRTHIVALKELTGLEIYHEENLMQNGHYCLFKIPKKKHN